MRRTGRGSHWEWRTIPSRRRKRSSQPGSALRVGSLFGLSRRRLCGEYRAERARLPHSRVDAQGKVIASLLKNKRGLCVFLHDPRVPMENNLSERILRGPVISRYLSFGSGGPRGAAATGVLLSVFETVRLAGLNPYTWTQDWLQACARNQGQPPRDLRPWLPWEMTQERRRELRAPPQWTGATPAGPPSPVETSSDLGPVVELPLAA